jgi:hypothetical protein
MDLQAPQPQQQTQRVDDLQQKWIPTKNMPALLAYYFGIFGLIPFLGIPLAITAIVLGIIGLKQFKQNPTPGAKGHAMTGLVLGIFEMLVLVVFIILMIVTSQLVHGD